MTISTSSLPAESLATGNPTCADAGLLAALGTANAPAGQTPADAATADAAGFAGLLPDADAPEPVASDPVNSEQAAAFAAALLWTPAPLLVEMAPNAGLTGVNAQPLAAEGEVETDLTAQGEPQTKSVAPATTQVASTVTPFAPPEANTESPSTAQVVAAKYPASQPVAQPAAPVPTAPSTPNVAAASLAANSPVPAATEPEGIPAAPANEPAVTDSAERPLGDPDILNVGRPWRAPASREKIAALAGRSAPDFDSSRAIGSKTFLTTTQQAGRGAAGIVGTGVAKSEPTMPSAPVIQPSAAEKSAALAALALPAGSHGQATQVTLPEITATVSSDPAVQARDAVAAVMQVVNAQEQTAGASRVVNLDFNFGADRLAVRVEQLHDGTVQAHFRTDSHELRAALAHEWQQAASAPENILRFAEPVYQSAARGDQSAGFGANAEGRASQDQARAQQQAAASSARPARAGPRPLSVTTTTEAPRVRASSSARHLQAVA